MDYLYKLFRKKPRHALHTPLLGREAAGWDPTDPVSIAYEMLFQSKIDPHVVLVWACRRGHLDAVKYVLSEGVDVHGNNGYALRAAAQTDHVHVLRYLLDEAGADVHADYDAALRWAAYDGKYAAASFLLDRGADVHVDRETPLRWSVMRGHADLTKLLLDHGADASASDDLALVLAHGHPAITEILLKHGNREQRNPEHK